MNIDSGWAQWQATGDPSLDDFFRRHRLRRTRTHQPNRSRPARASSLSDCVISCPPLSCSLRSRCSPYHSRITHSRHRTALGGHQRTPARSISYSRGRQGSLSDTGGHGTDTVRDREDEGSNPSPPTIFVFKITDFCCPSESAEPSRITISRGASESGSPERVFRLLR